MADESTQEVEISNPVLGRLAAKGVRVSDMIGLLTFLGVVVLGVFSYLSLGNAAAHKEETAKANESIATSIRQNAASQRLMTCIISLPQERREQEFTQPNSFCQRMSALP